jgi:undecaprenyl-diphosphatase
LSRVRPAAASPLDTARCAHDFEFDVTRPAPAGVSRLLARHLDLQPFVASLTVAAASFVAVVIVFLIAGAVVSRILESGPLARLDDQIVARVVEARSSTVTDVSVVASGLAETVPVIAIIVMGGAALLLARRPWMALLIGIGFVLQPSIYALVTYLVPRRRPPVTWLEPHLPPDASFPSGHVAAAVVLYGSAFLITATLTRNRRIIMASAAFGTIAVIAVGASRIYRGEHHVSDVAGGVILGLVCLATAVLAVRTGVARCDVQRRMTTAESPSGPSTRTRQLGDSSRADAE